VHSLRAPFDAEKTKGTGHWAERTADEPAFKKRFAHDGNAWPVNPHAFG
jgi:hypothetical protein